MYWRKMMDEEGWVPNPVVYITESEITSVLDKNGNPFTLRKKQKVGFDLTTKSTQLSNSGKEVSG
jgi:hypothetical protein